MRISDRPDVAPATPSDRLRRRQPSELTNLEQRIRRPDGGRGSDLLALQRLAGNRAVAQLLHAKTPAVVQRIPIRFRLNGQPVFLEPVSLVYDITNRMQQASHGKGFTFLQEVEEVLVQVSKRPGGIGSTDWNNAVHYNYQTVSARLRELQDPYYYDPDTIRHHRTILV